MGFETMVGAGNPCDEEQHILVDLADRGVNFIIERLEVPGGKKVRGSERANSCMEVWLAPAIRVGRTGVRNHQCRIVP